MARPLGSGRTPLRDRLLSRISITPAGCWEYTGSRNHKGYGAIGLGGKRGGSTGAHRASWMVHHGAIPDGLQVLHRCDNPPCVNPDHLFVGTPADNMNDKVQKGRASGPRGESHPRHKLTSADVQEIRSRYAAGGTTMRALAAEYDVSRPCIYYVIAHKTWSSAA